MTRTDHTIGNSPADTIAETIRHAAAALAGAGVGAAAEEARWLVAAALELEGASLISRAADRLDAGQLARVSAFLARRCRHEPLSRIVGEREFYGRLFRVTPATLDPRADSETVVDAVLALVADLGPRAAPLRLLDIGTGTGCLLLTLLAELPHARGVGTDLSAEALAVARLNGQRLGLDGRATWIETDLAHAVQGPFDIVISNPPYVRTADLPGLDCAVRNYDPHLALDGGPDGLDFYRRLVDGIPAPHGWIVMEVGYDQAQAVAALFDRAGAWANLQEIRFFHDVAGRRRVVAARTRTAGSAEKGLGFSASAS